MNRWFRFKLHSLVVVPALWESSAAGLRVADGGRRRPQRRRLGGVGMS